MKSFLVVVFCVAAGFDGVLCADRTLKRYPRQVEYAEGNVANSGHSPDVHGDYAIPSFPRQATSASYPGDLSAFLTTSPIPSSRDTDRKASRQVRRIDDPYPPQSFSPQGSFQNSPTSTVLFPGPSTIPQQSPPPQVFPSRYQPADYTVDALPPSHFSAPPPPPPNQGYVQNQQQTYSQPTSFQPQGQSIFSSPIQQSQPSFRPPIQDSQANFRPTIQNSQPSFRPTLQEAPPNFPPRPDVDLPPQIPLNFAPRPDQEPPRFPPRPDSNIPPRDTRFSTRPEVRNELAPNLPPRPDVDLPPPRQSSSLPIRPDVDVPTRQQAAEGPNQDIAPGRNFFSQPDTNFSPPIRTAPPRPLTTPSPPPTPPPPSQFRPLPSTRPPPPEPVSLTIPGQSYRNIRQPLNTVAVPPQPPYAPGNSIGASVAPFPFGDLGPESIQRPPTRDFVPQPTARPSVAPPARPQPIAFPRAQEKATRPPVRQPQEPPRSPPRRPVDEPEPRRRVPPQPIDEPRVPELPRHVPRRVINEPAPQRQAPRQPVSEPESPRQSRRPSRVRAEVPAEVAPKSFRIDTPLEFQRRPAESNEGISNARANRSRQPASPPLATSPAPTRAPRQPSSQNAPSRNTQRQPIQTTNNERNSRPTPRRENNSRDERPLPSPIEDIQARPPPTPEVAIRPNPPPVEDKPAPSSSPVPENTVRPPFSPQPPQRPLGAPIELPPGVPAVYDPNNPYPTPRKPLPGAPPPPPVPNNAQFPVLQNLPYPKKEEGPELRPLSATSSPPNAQTQRRRNPIISNEAVPENRRPSRPEQSPVIITPIRTPARDEAEQQTDTERPKNKRRRKHRRRTTVAPTTENKDLIEKPLTVPPQNLETASTPTVGPSSTPESLPKRRRNRRKKNRTTPTPASAGDSTLEDDEAPPNRGRLGRNRI